MVSKDPGASAKFYGKLFDWQIDAANALGYREVKTGNPQSLDGGIWLCPPEGQSMVQLFIEVPDVAACLQQATALGAKIIVPQSQLPDGDTLAILLDPAGLSSGIYRRREA
jgi:predicted enzyme related to lactoylglutathione lyase